ANAIFINQVYLDLLGRPVDSMGAGAWTAWMSQGAGRAQVVLAIEQSVEYRSRLVESLYATYLGRQADGGGLNAFVSALGSGATIEQVKAAILASPEYYQKAGGTDDGFVRALYQSVLRRAPDAAGESAWLANLANGVSRQTVASLILTSREADQDLVGALYSAYLNRTADPAGLSAWAAMLQNGMKDQDLLADILAS